MPREMTDQFDEDEIDLAEVFKTIKEGKTILLVTMLLVFLATLFYLWKTPDMYSTEAHIIPLKGRTNIAMEVIDTSDLSFLKDILQGSMPTVFSSPTTSKIKSTMLSKKLLLQVIGKYKLMPQLFPTAYDLEKKEWKEKKSCEEIKPHTFEKVTGIKLFSEPCHPTVMDGYRNLLKNVTVDRSDTFSKDSHLIQLSYKSTDPRFGQMLLTKLIFETDKSLRERAIKMATGNQSYLSTLRQHTKNDKVKSRLKTLIAIHTEQAMYAQTKADFFFSVMDPPIIADKPISPKRPLVLLVGLILGFILGIALIFFREFIKSEAMKS